jgi:3-hydroxybutyryl-CoA dehydrogenase/5-formyl-3-hydroxy-2-methylpyridine 4-carboxylate dehydrogenase
MSVPKVVTVLGSGTMGPGIAAIFARAGAEARLFDISEKAIENAKGAVTMAQSVLDQLGSIPDQGGVVSFYTDMEASLLGTAFVVEAVPEKLELKQQVLSDTEKFVGNDVVIASNTSGIPITKIGEALSRPELFVGMHWSNPPHVIPMIEVVPGDSTSQQTIDDLISIVHSFGYEAVVEKEKPGFVENRILYAIMREALALVDEGIISQKDMDTCVKWGIGYKLAVVGPMRLLDMAGLDIYTSVAGYLNPDLSNDPSVPAVVSDLVTDGKLGMKTAGGMFPYGDGDVAAIRGEIVQQFIAVRKAMTPPLGESRI